MIECHRPCHHCDYVHVFVSDHDDAEDCPRCGQELYPVATIVTEVAAAADRIERALVDGQEALACWSRIDDLAPLARPVVGDIAKRLVDAALTKSMVEVLDRARAYARVKEASTEFVFASSAGVASLDSLKALDEATSALLLAAQLLDEKCIACSARNVVLDAYRHCPSCGPKLEAEADLNNRCRKALAAFDSRDPRSFAKATKEIVADRPDMTMIEFFERAMGEWEPSRSRRAP